MSFQYWVHKRLFGVLVRESVTREVFLQEFEDAERLHEAVVVQFPHITSEMVDEAVEAWHQMPPGLLLDDQMRFILGRVLKKEES